MKYTIIEKRKESYLIRNKKGEYQKIPVPKFYDGQIVTTTKKNHSHSDVIQVTDLFYVIWSGVGLWTYFVNYAKISGNKVSIEGGSSGNWPEENFKALENTSHKIMAEIYYREKKLYDMEVECKNLKNQMYKLKYTLDLING